MIQYSLKCAKGHAFDSWFQSASAFDRLSGARMVECAVCGGTDVDKAVMTPRVGSSRAEERPLSKAKSPAEQAMAELRRKIEANADYVGRDFAREARAMHDGDAPERAIFGEAAIGEARKLVEDGIPVAPLPFLPNRKTN